MSGKIHLVCGEDSYLAHRKVQELIEASAPPDARDLGVEVFEPESARADDVVGTLWRALETVQTSGFFGNRRTVCLRKIDPLFAARPQQARPVAEAAEALTKWIADNTLPDDHLLILEAQNVQRTSALYKGLHKCAEIHDFKVGSRPHERQQHALEQLDERLRHNGLRMPVGLRRRFIERVGTDTWRIVSEIEKLDLFLMPDRNVTEAAILEATVMGSLDAAWDLTDAFGARDLAGTLTALRRLLLQRQSVIGLATQLENRVRDLLIYREAADRGWLRVSKSDRGYRSVGIPQWGALPENIQQAFSQMHADPRNANRFYAGRLAEQAASFSLRELRNARHLLMSARERMVSTGLAPDVLLELALCRILAKRGANARRTPAS